jgi:aminocarboxymuconate-semialdehyde decarboxylase
LTPIDVHTHVVPHDFPAYAGRGRNLPWPEMADAGCGHRHVTIAGRHFRTVPETCWDGAARGAAMDAQGVGRHVLSPMPELLSCWMEAEDALPLLRFVNERIAAIVAEQPARFFGLGAVPLQDVALAVAELDRVMREQRLAGVEVPGHVRGRPIGDETFEPFWAAAEDLGAAVFVHPLKPLGVPSLVGPPGLEPLIAFPSDTGFALASLLTGGVLERHPRLRIAASHGGGTLATLLPRLQHGWQITPALQAAMPTAPAELARRLYFDTLVYDDAALRALIDRFGANRLLMGSDFPFAIADPERVGRIERLDLPEAAREALRWRNAERWLGVH